MQLIADGLLLATALTAALYCIVLSRRLRRLTDAQSGIGTQIRELTRVLEETRGAVGETRNGLAENRAAARNASDAVAREIARAQDAVAELHRARSAALGALTRAATSPVPPGGEQHTGEAWDDAQDDAEDREPDTIPDWPDGVIDQPAASKAVGETAPRPVGGPLRVERIGL